MRSDISECAAVELNYLLQRVLKLVGIRFLDPISDLLIAVYGAESGILKALVKKYYRNPRYQRVKNFIRGRKTKDLTRRSLAQALKSQLGERRGGRDK